MDRPPIVSEQEWRSARDALLVKEKAATRALDALAAERRRLPMVRIEKSYRFESPRGHASLVDLFEGRRQLVLYHFMFAPGTVHPCEGCSTFTDNVGDLTHLQQRDTTFALTARAPVAEAARRSSGGWAGPYPGTRRTDPISTATSGSPPPTGTETFGLSVFLRDGDEVFRTYHTNGRGVDRLRFDFNLLDLTPFGRQEQWEDSPPGWPQTPPYGWWRLHDEYEPETG